MDDWKGIGWLFFMISGVAFTAWMLGWREGANDVKALYKPLLDKIEALRDKFPELRETKKDEDTIH